MWGSLKQAVRYYTNFFKKLQKPCPEIQPASAAAGFTTYLTVLWSDQFPELRLGLREVTVGYEKNIPCAR